MPYMAGTYAIYLGVSGKQPYGKNDALSPLLLPLLHTEWRIMMKTNGTITFNPATASDIAEILRDLAKRIESGYYEDVSLSMHQGVMRDYEKETGGFVCKKPSGVRTFLLTVTRSPSVTSSQANNDAVLGGNKERHNQSACDA